MHQKEAKSPTPSATSKTTTLFIPGKFSIPGMDPCHHQSQGSPNDLRDWTKDPEMGIQPWYS